MPLENSTDLIAQKLIYDKFPNNSNKIFYIFKIYTKYLINKKLILHGNKLIAA